MRKSAFRLVRKQNLAANFPLLQLSQVVSGGWGVLEYDIRRESRSDVGPRSCRSLRTGGETQDSLTLVQVTGVQVLNSYENHTYTVSLLRPILYKLPRGIPALNF